MEKRFGNEKRSLLSADLSDLRVICQAGAVLASVLLIIGLLMLLPIGAVSSMRATASIAFLAAGSVLLITGILYLRRTKDEPAEVGAGDARAEWRRFFIAASAYAVITLVLTVLNIRLELALSLPIAILSVYLLWLYVLQKRNKRALLKQ